LQSSDIEVERFRIIIDDDGFFPKHSAQFTPRCGRRE
jgi:hypothetical protein